jgi:chromosome partitioning protein
VRTRNSSGSTSSTQVIPENIKLAEAPMESKPIALHDNSATGAEAFRALTEEFLKRLEG